MNNKNNNGIHMAQIIDFRNAKYQGQLLNGQPHGIGIISIISGLMIDFGNVFCLAQWNHGQIDGKVVVIFGDSKIFYGQIKNKKPAGVCTYHLKDKCQIFYNFQDGVLEQPNQPDQKQKKHNKIVALLPTFRMIIKVEGKNQEQLEIKGQEIYRQNDFETLKKLLEEMLNLTFQPGELETFLSLEDFININFFRNPYYSDLLDIVEVGGADGKQIFLTLKTQIGQPSLGIRIQNCMQNSNNLTNLHNDGSNYIIKAMGYFNKQGSLIYGLKNIKTMIKGNVMQQAIYKDESTIIRYEDKAVRPKQCAINLLSYFKKSPFYRNSYLEVRHLHFLQSDCLNINFNIKQIQTKKYAQLILQNPKELSLIEKQKIEQARSRKLHNGSVQKNSKSQALSNPYQTIIENSLKKNEQLEKAKEQIYRSISKKKIHGNSKSPFSQQRSNLANSPEAQFKPAQVMNIKPILDIYKNIPQNFYYNSMKPGNQVKNNDKPLNGYIFNLTKNQEVSDQINSNINDQNKQNSIQSTDYFKSLQSRRRLYQQSEFYKEPVKKPTSQSQTNFKMTPNRKRFAYLPEQDSMIDNPGYLSYRRNIPANVNQQPRYKKINRYEDPFDLPLTYPLHKNYDQNSSGNQNQNYFRSQRKSPCQDKQKGKYQNQVGRLGLRTLKKQIYYGNSSPLTNLQRNISSPIIVPQFKINSTTIGQYRKQPLEDETLGPNPKREHALRYNHENQSKSPLRSQQYRKEQLETSPIKRIETSIKTPQKNKYYKDVIIDPSVNYARQDLADKYSNLDKNYKDNQNFLTQKQQHKTKSPAPKRKKILNDNPFDF